MQMTHKCMWKINIHIVFLTWTTQNLKIGKTKRNRRIGREWFVLIYYQRPVSPKPPKRRCEHSMTYRGPTTHPVVNMSSVSLCLTACLTDRRVERMTGIK